jgi:hypothetical protein
MEPPNDRAPLVQKIGATSIAEIEKLIGELQDRIDFALRETGNDVPTYPVVDPVSCGDKVGHGRSPRLSAPYSAPSEQTSKARLGSPHKGRPNMSRRIRKPRLTSGSIHEGTRARGSSGERRAVYFDTCCTARAHNRSGSHSPCFANSIINLATSAVSGSVRSVNRSLPNVASNAADNFAMSSGPNE